MKKVYRNQRGFTLVEIMMVVIIIGVLAILGIPRYRKYLLESKLAEVQVNLGEIKQGQAKYYNSHKQKYSDILTGVNEDVEKKLRIEFGAKVNFDYTIAAYGTDKSDGYVVKAELTADGADEFNAEVGRCLWFIYPTENRPDTEIWEKGWNDEEFFDDDLAAGSEEVTSVTDAAAAVHTVTWSAGP